MTAPNELQPFANAVLRFFAAPKQKIATCVLADRPVEHENKHAWPVASDPNPIGGIVRFATMYLTDGRIIDGITCGLAGSGAMIELERMDLMAGEEFKPPALVMVPEVIDMKHLLRNVEPRPIGRATVIRKEDKDRVFDSALTYYSEAGIELDGEAIKLLRAQADHGLTLEEILPTIDAEIGVEINET